MSVSCRSLFCLFFLFSFCFFLFLFVSSSSSSSSFLHLSFLSHTVSSFSILLFSFLSWYFLRYSIVHVRYTVSFRSTQPIFCSFAVVPLVVYRTSLHVARLTPPLVLTPTSARTNQTIQLLPRTALCSD